MANKVSFIIDLKNKFSRSASKVNRSIRSIGSTANRTTGILRNKLGAGITKLRALAVGGFAAMGVAAVAGTKKSISAFDNLEFALANLSAITGASGKALVSLEQDSLRLSKATNFSSVEIVNAFTQIASAKSELLENPGELAQVAAQVFTLAKAAQITAETASRASIGSLNQFKAGADQAERFVNVLAAGAKIGASLVSETADALKNVGAIAAEFGLSFEQTNAAIQVLAKSEKKGAEAGTGLKTMLSKLEKIGGGRFAPSKIGFIKSLEAIKTLGLSNIQIIELFGEEALSTVLILQTNVPLIKQWTKALTGTNVAQQQSNIISDTAIERSKALGNAFTRLRESIGKGLAPTVEKMKVAFSAWFDSFDERDIEGIVNIFKGLLLVLQVISKTILLAAKSVKFLVEGLGEFIAKIDSGSGRIGEFLLTLATFPGVVLDAGIEFFIKPPDPKDIKKVRDAAHPEPDVIKAMLDVARPDPKDIKKALDIVHPENIKKRLDIAHQVSSAATLQGEIVVSANNGAKVESTTLTIKNDNMNIGINMVPAQ